MPAPVFTDVVATMFIVALFVFLMSLFPLPCKRRFVSASYVIYGLAFLLNATRLVDRPFTAGRAIWAIVCVWFGGGMLALARSRQQ